MKVLVLILVFAGNVLAYDICGDRECGPTETSYSCPDDCLTGSYDLYCDEAMDALCDPDCQGNDPDCIGYSGKSSGSPLKLILGIGVLLLLMFFLFLLIRRVKSQGVHQ